MSTVSPDVLHELAPTGVLRAAINFGNPVLAQRAPGTGVPQGISVDLAQEIGRRLGVPVTFTTFDAAGKVFEAVGSNTLDVMFLALDPIRASEILFTAPYVVIEGSYLVREASSLRHIEDFDQPGVRIAVGKGAAYDLFLSRTLKYATLVRSETSASAVELFIDSDLDAAAGVRQPLLGYAAAHAGYRVIDGRFTAIEQAVGTPKGRPAARAWLHHFIEAMKANGFVTAALRRNGQNDASVASTQAIWPTF